MAGSTASEEELAVLGDVAVVEAHRSLDAQLAAREHLRGRAGTLIAVAALVATFLGRTQTAVASAPLPVAVLGWFGAFSLALSITLCMYILIPKGNWREGLDSNLIVEAWIQRRHKFKDPLKIEIAKQIEKAYSINSIKLNEMYSAFRWSVIGLVLALASWLLADLLSPT
ncbi:MAG TPA: hypothetical protein VHQ65_12700 [Thermoanaerobaculia bacterium]|nr:hypothetical protein [Thermoanaerobaculia bacterium]